MTNRRRALIAVLGCLALALTGTQVRGAEAAASTEKPIRILVVTGGHDFEKEPFFKLFKEMPGVTFEAVAHPQAHDRLKAEAAGTWDVLVLYDMWAEISDPAKADFVARLKEGKGLVALHHCLASYQKWDEYARIIGGKYHSEKWTQDGVEKPASTYLHDVNWTVHVADASHPVCRGIKDFQIHDETYGGTEVHPDAHPLLTTDEPTNGRTVAWVKSYGAARVVYLQLGHDHQAYQNANYRRLLEQAIRWAAKRE